MSSFLPLSYSEVKFKKLFCHRRFAAIGAEEFEEWKAQRAKEAEAKKERSV